MTYERNNGREEKREEKGRSRKVEQGGKEKVLSSNTLSPTALAVNKST